MAELSRRRFMQTAAAAAAVPPIAAVSVGALAQSEPRPQSDAHAQNDVVAQRGDSSGALAQSDVVAQSGGPAQSAGEPRVERDIVFGQGGEKDLLLDVYYPPEGVSSKRTAIVHLFGGGFRTGDKAAEYLVNDVRALSRLGYTNVSATYRLQSEAFWPAQIFDTKAAIRWTRANAERLGVDADKIAIAGYSAGGMLALLAAGTNGVEELEGEGGTPGVSSDVQACIGVYPATSAASARGLFSPDLSEPQLANAIEAASPTTYWGERFAPTILIHGTEDGTVPAASSIEFFSALQQHGVPSALTLIQGADHVFDATELDAVELMTRSIDLFLDRLIVSPKPYPRFRPGGASRG